MKPFNQADLWKPVVIAQPRPETRYSNLQPHLLMLIMTHEESAEYPVLEAWQEFMNRQMQQYIGYDRDANKFITISDYVKQVLHEGRDPTTGKAYENGSHD